MKRLRSVLVVLLVLSLLIGCMPVVFAAAPAAEAVEAQLDAARAKAVRSDLALAQTLKSATNSYLAPDVTTDGQAVVRGSSTTIRMSGYSASKSYTHWIFFYPGKFADSANADYVEYASETCHYGYAAYTYKWTAKPNLYNVGDYCIVTCVTDENGDLDADSVCYADLKVVSSAAALNSISLAYAVDQSPVGSEEVVMTVDETEEIYIRFDPYHTTADRLVNCTSSDPQVAAVDTFMGISVIEAVAPGTATITGSCAGKTAAMKIRVIPSVNAISIDSKADSLCHDTSLQLTAVVNPAEYAEYVTWSSSDPGVARVEPDGTVLGLSTGTATITATCGARSASMVIHVNDHDFVGETTVEPNTATQPGLETGTCTLCGGEGMTNVLPAIFTDTIPTQWYAEFVDYVYEHQLMNGVGVDIFNPIGKLNRAMVVTILYRIAGTPEVAEAPSFSDVETGEWYTDAVVWAADNGIVTGYPNGTFLPEKAVTREQIATMMYRFARFNGEEITNLADLGDFTDGGSVSSYAVTAMRWAVEAKLINGISTEGVVTLSPRGTATRAQFAAVIARYQQTERQQGINLSLFDGKLSLQLPASWAGHFVVKQTPTKASFYSAKNHETLWGGHVFTLVLSDLSSEEDLAAMNFAHYEYLDKWSGGIVYALYPTDVQYNYEDEQMAGEYIALYNDLKDVISTVTITEA